MKIKTAAATREFVPGSVQTDARRRGVRLHYRIADENPANPKKSGDGVLEEGERARLDLA